MDFSIDLDPAVIWNHVLRNWDPFMDGYSLLDYRIMFHTVGENISDRDQML